MIVLGLTVICVRIGCRIAKVRRQRNFAYITRVRRGLRGAVYSNPIRESDVDDVVEMEDM